MSGALEETNEPYAIAKIAGIKMCESYNRQFGRDYRSVMQLIFMDLVTIITLKTAM